MQYAVARDPVQILALGPARPALHLDNPSSTNAIKSLGPGHIRRLFLSPAGFPRESTSTADGVASKQVPSHQLALGRGQQTAASSGYCGNGPGRDDGFLGIIYVFTQAPLG